MCDCVDGYYNSIGLMLSGTRWILCQNQFILWQVEQVLWNLLSISMGWCQRAESAELQISIYRKCVAFGKYESALMSIPEWANVWKNRRWLLMNSDGCYIWIRINKELQTSLNCTLSYSSRLLEDILRNDRWINWLLRKKIALLFLVLAYCVYHSQHYLGTGFGD